MRNLYYILYTAILLQSCGFQSRKYTTGYYGPNAQNRHLHHNTVSSHSSSSITPHPLTYLEISEEESSKKWVDRSLSAEIPHAEQTSERLNQRFSDTIVVREIKESNKHEAHDTLKINLFSEKRDSTYLNPKEIDHWVKIRRKNTLCKGITLCLTLFSALLLPYSIDDNAFLIALAIVSVILIIFSLRIVIADIKLHRLMKSRPTEDKIKNWYKQQHRRNVLAALLLPLNGIMLYMCAILAVLGIAILFGWV